MNNFLGNKGISKMPHVVLKELATARFKLPENLGRIRMAVENVKNKGSATMRPRSDFEKKTPKKVA